MKRENSKIRIILTALLTMVVIGCIMYIMLAAGDPTARVITLKDGAETADFVYYNVYGNGKVRKTGEFKADDTARFYTADIDCFSSDVVDGKVKNTLMNIVLTDESGDITEADTTMASLMQMLADEIDHDILSAVIIEDKGQYFAWVELNTNWSSPCELYQYNEEENTIEMIGKWDGVDLIGISVA